MALTFIVPGLDEAASEKIIGILQNRLSQEQEAALVLKHAHWNVTGENFIAVHEMIDPQVEAVLNMADETAERIATLGRESECAPRSCKKWFKVATRNLRGHVADRR